MTSNTVLNGKEELWIIDRWYRRFMKMQKLVQN